MRPSKFTPVLLLCFSLLIPWVSLIAQEGSTLDSQCPVIGCHDFVTAASVVDNFDFSPVPQESAEEAWDLAMEACQQEKVALGQTPYSNGVCTQIIAGQVASCVTAGCNATVSIPTEVWQCAILNCENVIPSDSGENYKKKCTWKNTGFPQEGHPPYGYPQDDWNLQLADLDSAPDKCKVTSGNEPEGWRCRYILVRDLTGSCSPNDKCDGPGECQSQEEVQKGSVDTSKTEKELIPTEIDQIILEMFAGLNK